MATPGSSGDLADPDGDGVPNLLEYAFNLDPRKPATTGLPVPGQTTIAGKAYSTLSYTRVIAATDITYVPQVSGDLTAWHSGPSYVADVSVTDNPDGTTQTVVVGDLIPLGVVGSRFARLTISRR